MTHNQFFPNQQNKARLGEIPATRNPQPAARGVGGGVREGYSSCHTLVSGATLYYIRWSNSPSTSNVGLNFSTTSTAICCHIQVGQREFQNLSNGPTAQNSPNSNNPPQSLIGTSHHFPSRTLFYIPVCSGDCYVELPC